MPKGYFKNTNKPINGMLGKKHSKETKERMGLVKKGIKPKNWDSIQGMRKGIKLTIEERQKISDATKLAMRSPKIRLKISKANFGRKHPHTKETKRKIGLANSIALKGHKVTEETKRKLSLALKGKKMNPEVGRKISKRRMERKQRLGYINSPETREKIRIKRLNQIFPTKDTSIEIKVQNALKEKGIDFEKHKVLLNRYQVDIFIEPNIAIEADGDYWHNRKGVKERDRIKTTELVNNGFVVYRFWEHEINESPQKCIDKLFK